LRQTHTANASTFETLDLECRIQVLDPLTFVWQVPSLGHEETGERSVAAIFRKVEMKLAICVAHREHTAQEVRTIGLFQYLLRSYLAATKKHKMHKKNLLYVSFCAFLWLRLGDQGQLDKTLAVDPLCRFFVVLRLGPEDVLYKRLRVAIVEREPARLNLDHDAVSR